MAIRDLNVEVGTVSRDATRHTGATGPGKEWERPADCNDGSPTTWATVLSNIAAFSDYMVADLGAVYRVSSFKWHSSSGWGNLDLPQWGEGPTGPWHDLAYTESGPGRATGPDGNTLAFDPIDARYWSMRAAAGGFHPAISQNVWQIMGDDVPTGLDCDFSATPVAGAPPLEVDFTDLTTGGPDGWLWAFGDGDTSTEQNPTHVYADPGDYTVSLVATRSSDSDECTRLIAAFIEVHPVAWDVFAADDLHGPIIATLTNAKDRMIRIEEDGPGLGGFRINRHSPEATEAILAKGNLVRVAIPDISTDYIGAFFIERGDFDILSSSEEGAEDLEFAGRGAFSYLGRARMWNEAYSTGLDISDTWTEIWRTSKIVNPVGVALDPASDDYVYVISATTRKIYKLRQSDRAIVASSPALWSGADNYAGGLSADPADSTILWVLEAPWSQGGAGNTKIRKVRISDWAILDTFNLGSAVKLTEIKASATNLWSSRYETNNAIQKRSKADGLVVTSYDITYNGTAQVNATGISVNGTRLAYWFAGKKRALISDESHPTTIDDVIATTGISAFGGDWTTEGVNEFFYPVSYTADVTWKYQVTTASPRDPVDGIWRLDEGTPGAILARIMAEIKHPDRPQQPVPDLVYAFDFLTDTDENPWDSHPGTIEFTASIGDYVDETVLRLIPYGLTVQMEPNTLELLAYNDQDFGVDRTSGTFTAGKVRVEGAINAAEALRRRMDDRKVDSHILVGGAGGAFGVATDDDLGYVREGFLSSNVSDIGSLEGTGEAELARQRRDADAQAVVIPWGDDEAAGFYLPGPLGTNGHYWVGDRIRVDSGSDSFDLVEADRDVKAITIEEIEGGWNAVVDLASVFLPIYDPVAPAAPGSIGGTAGAGSTTTTVNAEIAVKDSTNGESYLGKTIESDDWGVFQAGTGRVGVSIRGRGIRDATDFLEAEPIADGQGIAWDAVLEAFVPAELGGGGAGHGYHSALTPQAAITATKDAGNPTFAFDAIPEGVVNVDDVYWAVYIETTGGPISLATATDRDGPWTAHAGNPIYDIADVPWAAASTGIYAPFILDHEGVFYLYYSVNKTSGATDAGNAIGVATAPSIEGPYVDSGAAILSPGAGAAWDSRRVGECDVLFHDDRFVMAYMGETSAAAYQASEKVGIATASSPTGPWTKASGNPTLDFGASGEWDDALIADPSIVFDNGYYWIMYAGGIDSGPSTKAEQGLAYALDPTGTWTRYSGNPILTVGAGGTWDDVWVFRGTLWLEDGLWGGIYAGYSGSAFRGGNFRLTIESATGGVTDHGALSGLADDDHTQYLDETRHDALAHEGLSGLLTVDPGTPSYDTSGADVVTTVTSTWGVDADGPYYDSAGVTSGDEAILALDPAVGDLVVIPYNP